MDIRVDKQGTPLPNFWNHIHFHPTDAIEDEWGQKILNDVAADGVARTVRMYAMFEDMVTRDEAGQLHFDFTENDVRMDYMVSKGFNLLVSYNFIPPFLARDASLQSNMAKNKTRYKGKMIITSPPSNYSIWEEICYQYTKHLLERYGKERVQNWYLQCLNEPDIPNFWMGDLDRSVKSKFRRLQEYCKLYDGFEAGIRRASTELKIGGPALAHSIMFLDGFLQHVKDKGRQLDYVCVHSYGTSPKFLNDGTKPFCVDNNILKIRACMDTLHLQFPQGKELVVDEWGASTSGFFNREECSQLMMRETPGLAAYFGKLVTRLIQLNTAPDKLIICLSGQHEMVVDFSGFRNLFTMNHIRKPIYNAYILMSRLGDRLLEAATEGDTTVLATKQGSTVSILLSHAAPNFDRQLPEKLQQLTLTGVKGSHSVTLWRIDGDHTNPYGVYLKEGMTDPLSSYQIERLCSEGFLKPETFSVTADADEKVQLAVPLTGDSLVLLQLDQEA